MMHRRWYVLRSKPNKERELCKFARSQGHIIFFPTIPVCPVNPRAAKIRPYFPGYMFLHTDIDQVGQSTFHWMPFSQSLVCVGGEPACVPENIINALYRRVEEIWSMDGPLSDGFTQGDRVYVREGFFKGYHAIFDVRLSGSDRVRILLEMLNDRHVPLEIEVGKLESIECL
jgi:transcription antitermination factor NusG